VFTLTFYSVALPSTLILLLRWFSISLRSVLTFPVLYLGWSIVTGSGFHQLFSFALLVMVVLVHFLAFSPFSAYTFPSGLITITWSALCIALSPVQRWIYVPKEVDNSLPEMIEYTSDRPSDRLFITELEYIASVCEYVLIYMIILLPFMASRQMLRQLGPLTLRARAAAQFCGSKICCLSRMD
jgi:hypothetical protein